MSEIQIQVTTPNGDPHDIAAPLDMRVDAFIDALRDELRLARTDAEGHPIVWHLYSKASGRELVSDQTLQQNGVQAAHRLNLVRRTVAG